MAKVKFYRELTFGTIIDEEDAFPYVMEQCFKDDSVLNEIVEIAKDATDAEDFKKNAVEWFYSGNWLPGEMEVD